MRWVGGVGFHELLSLTGVFEVGVLFPTGGLFEYLCFVVGSDSQI